MSIRWLAFTAAALTLVACGAETASGPQDFKRARMEVESLAADSVAAAAPAPTMAVEQGMVQQEEPGGGGQTAPNPGVARQIAYEYQFTFAVPTAAMADLLNLQRQSCERAGSAKCYVVSSSLSGLGQDNTYGAMQLRASADWVAAFRAGLPEALKPFQAVLDASTESSEDLTTQIIDTGARLASMKTMRDRLVTALAERPGKLSDLLELERELARVQGDIDSTESILTAMRQRVSMSLLTLSYQPRFTAGSESIWRPVADAFGAFLPNAVNSLAVVVSFVAGLLPWLVILGVAILLLQLLWRLTLGRRRKPAPHPPAPAR